jgi:hypothetical protein
VMSKAWAWAAQAALCYMLLLRFDAAVSRLAYCKVRDREPSRGVARCASWVCRACSLVVYWPVAGGGYQRKNSYVNSYGA